MQGQQQPHETIEVGLDTESNQITIVVGTDLDGVQSVVVVNPHEQKNRKFKHPLSNPKKSNSGAISHMKALKSFAAPIRASRSDLLRPDSPMPDRSSVFEGRRGGEREQPPQPESASNAATNGRGRDSFRGRSKSQVTQRGSVVASSVGSRVTLRKQSSTHSIDTQGTKGSIRRKYLSRLHSMDETKTQHYKSRRQSNFISGSFWNHKVGAVVMVADV